MTGVRGLTGWVGTVLGTPDPQGLARFYAGLLGGEVGAGDDDFVTLKIDGSTHYLAFQLEVGHRAPVWPAPGSGEQQMQAHLDVGVSSLTDAVEDAVALGARVAEFQPQEDVRVLLDPAGHPFCLYVDDEG